jgi:hypothetical protein
MELNVRYSVFSNKATAETPHITERKIDVFY